jgi:hypothetical protein
MDDDVKRVIYLTIIGFLVVVLSWLTLIYVSSCGFTLSCNRAAPYVIRTPVPTLIPVSMKEIQATQKAPSEFAACYASATDLIGAWVTAGSPETEPFPFTDANGVNCQGTFATDIQHLFVENQLWYTGSLGCTSCHNADLTDRSGGLDLSSYQGIIAGSNRSYEGAKGTDILGGGNWESSKLHDVLLVQGLVPAGHSPDVDPVAPVFLYAGQKAPEASTITPTVTATATP